ncbi:MAG: hypothetical protein J1E62_07865 [Lachnospiraceae bacterium]|nr:hypothetical protein [Lachnospiraceae bacterium]
MDDKSSVSPKTVPEGIKTIVRNWDEIDKSKLIGLESDESQRYIVQDGEIAIWPV